MSDVESSYDEAVNVPPLREYRSQIEAALAYADDSHDFEDVAASVASGNMQYWPGVRSVIVTEIIVYPRYKALNFFLAGGDLAELEFMYPRVEAWGRMMGCDRAVLTGRKGWERSFLTRREGWHPTLAVFEKPLRGEE